MIPKTPCPNQAVPRIIKTTKRYSTHPLDTGIIIICMNNDVEIVISQKAPSIRANALMILFNKVCTTFGIAFAGQLHRFSPLVKASIPIALGCVIIITIALNF